MKIELDDNGLHLRFAPLSLTRPVGNLRMGIFTNDERWRRFLPDVKISYQTEKYLSGKFESNTDDDVIPVNASVIPNEDVVAAVSHLEKDEVLMFSDVWLAGDKTAKKKVVYKGQDPIVLEQRWGLFMKNDVVLEADFKLITLGRESAGLAESNLIIGDPNRIFIEEGAVVEGSILNTKSGPIYIGKNSEIMEGCMVRGGLALCDGAVLKMGAKIYGATTIGPECRVGGEVNNVIFQAYSNKGHDGFLGNSLIGEWCNLGADTNTSNLKNNYGFIKTFSFETGKVEQTDLQFMGLCMGDHSKTGINTMFNTATIVGVSANVYGSGFPYKFIPSFSWGGSEGTIKFRFDKAMEVARNMMGRRKVMLTEHDEEILKYLESSAYN
jgi:UDP-N-acetylglucosamine diphosphorylase/glucosamine-1-phosphate N-acetyltransferase